MKPKLAFTLDEAAEACGYSVATLRRALRNHDLIARYANSKPVILVSELEEWLCSLPMEPKGGYPPVSRFAEDEQSDLPGPELDVSGQGQPLQALADPEAASGQPRTQRSSSPVFRTPEEVAPELGISKSSVRTFCRISGAYTRVGNRMMMHADDVEELVEWLRQRQANKDGRWVEPERDPFA
ncbi:hypothetical protein KIH31_01115 [Paenarthrobacter sp. DKR-5]|nr:hypothetical protein [Paenarthrobacter sp. DKR-5]